MAKIYKAELLTKWISVDEKLPDSSDDYLVMTETGDVYRAYLNNQMTWMMYNDGYYDQELEDVEYWTELPKFN